MEEPLLKLNRDYTDKELIEIQKRKIDSLTKTLTKEIELNQDLYNRIQRLKNHVDILLDQQQATEDIIGTGLFVKRKTHTKLQKSYVELEKRFWEVVAERDTLKQNYDNS